MTDPREAALQYLNDKKVLKLFEVLGTRLAFVKPDQPNEFLLSELRKIQELKANGGAVTLFSDDDLTNMFAIFDITGRGYITQIQYKRALEAVGIDPTTARYTPSSDMIEKGTFVKNIVWMYVSKSGDFRVRVGLDRVAVNCTSARIN